jgi:hypothetical protein
MAEGQIGFREIVSPYSVVTKDPTDPGTLKLAIVPTIWFVCLFYSVELTKNAFVFADEAGYFLPLLFGTATRNYQRWGSSVVEYPAYLYFWFYSFLPKTDLYFWIKMTNAAFVAATAFPAFLVAKPYLPRYQAILFAAFVSMTPVASYARYAMPESMYFFGFWCTIAIVLSLYGRSVFLAAMIGGVSLGLLSLVKPHAIAIAIPLSIFLVIVRPTLRGCAASIFQIGTFYVAHVGMGFLLTGAPLWSFSSGVYRGIIEWAGINWGAAILNFSGHIAALFALLGPLMIFPIVHLKTAVNKEVGILGLLLVFSMVGMTVYNAQHVFQISPDAIEINELDGRFYIYPLPLFVLSAAICLNRGPVIVTPRYLIAAFMLIATVCSIIVLLFYKVGPVEFPDLTVLGGRSLISISIGTILAQFCVAILFFFPLTTTTKIKASVFAFIAIEMVTTFGLVFVAPTHKLSRNLIDTAFLSGVGGAVAELRGRSDGIVIGTVAQSGDLARALFYLGSMSASKIIPPDYEFVDTDFAVDENWALLLPGIRYGGNEKPVPDESLTIIRRKEGPRPRQVP